MNWDALDFVVAAALIGSVGLTYWLLVRHSGHAAFRAGLAVALAAALILTWISGAVGIIGSENNDANFMYAAVIGVAVIGAFFARLEPAGMARVLFATALAQVFVGVVAIVFKLGATAPSWPLDVLFLTLFFASLWLISGQLFRISAREHA